jgi:hypothetical protein
LNIVKSLLNVKLYKNLSLANLGQGLVN